MENDKGITWHQLEPPPKPVYMCMHICLHMDTHVTTHTVGRGSWCCQSPGLCARWMDECMGFVLAIGHPSVRETSTLSDPLQYPGRRWLPGCLRRLLWPVIGSQEIGHLAVQMASCLFRRQMLGLALGASRPDVSVSPYSQQTTSILAILLAYISHEHSLPGSIIPVPAVLWAPGLAC